MTVSTDIAKRVYDHTFKLDPIVRSLLDTDFYKLLMLQMIWGLYGDVRATFSLINRTARVRVADEVDERELRDQLDHARTLRFTKKEMIWLAGNSFYGRAHIFDAKFLAWLADFQLPEYELRRHVGQYELHFDGPGPHHHVGNPSLAIINELRSRAALRHYGRFTLDVLYARAKAKLWSKVERLRQLPPRPLRISDFGTRRRHGFLWQRWCVEALKEGLGDALIGTTNVLLAMDNDLEAIGTNAHELPMVYAALAHDDDALRERPIECCATGALIIPATCWSCCRTPSAPRRSYATRPTGSRTGQGFRPDSAPPIAGGEEIIAWWISDGRDPHEKLLVFSDALDADTIEAAYRHFAAG